MSLHATRFGVAAAFAAALTACAPASPPTPVAAFPASWTHQTDRPAEGRRGMVTSDAAIASQVGAEILRSGGNAVDAAVATGFALAVVYPEAGNLGGGGFSLVRMADGRVAALDYRETAPMAATRDMFASDTGSPRRSVVGPLASGVPGSVAGLTELHKKFGALPLARVMAPAIRLAETGFTVDAQLAASLARHQRHVARFAGASVFLPGGRPLDVGSVLRQPALARTLQIIADSGGAAFYTGPWSKVVVNDLKAAGSIITMEDLAIYKAEWREPIKTVYRGHAVLTMPPPASGATLVQALNILEGFDPFPRFGSTRHAHLVASALQRSFVDRNMLLGDPAFSAVPVDRLTDKAYAAKLRAGIGSRATPTIVTTAAMRQGQNTTHYAVVDEAGNAVSTTTTINDLYGSGVYLPNVGFFMNDEMDDFAARPGVPNAFGLVQGEQNAIAPVKRMLSSMSPTIVLDRDGMPFLLVGARGGPRIVSSVLQTIMNVIDHGMLLGDAIGAPRLHHQAIPDTIRFERNGLSPALVDSLRSMGWGLAVWGIGPVLSPDGNLGSVNGILRVETRWTGYSDPRAGGRAVGY